MSAKTSSAIEQAIDRDNAFALASLIYLTSEAERGNLLRLARSVGAVLCIAYLESVLQ